MQTFAALKLTKEKPEEVEISGLIMTICNLALEGERSQLFATVKTQLDENDFEEIRTKLYDLFNV